MLLWQIARAADFEKESEYRESSYPDRRKKCNAFGRFIIICKKANDGLKYRNRKANPADSLKPAKAGMLE